MWVQVQIPHDWAIGGPFDKKWDLQRVAITQNGETEATEKSGRSGALPWIGEGWYRTTVEIPQGYEAGELVFDGAMPGGCDPVFEEATHIRHLGTGYSCPSAEFGGEQPLVSWRRIVSSCQIAIDPEDAY